jgi:hypothetical protein
MRAMRKAALTLVLAACGGQPPPPPPAPVAVPTQPPEPIALAVVDAGAPATSEPAVMLPSANATCMIRASNVEPIALVPLRAAGKLFARLRGPQSIDLRLEKTGGTATVETTELTITGEVDVADIIVSAKPELHDGWWRLGSAKARSVSGDAMTLDVRLASFVKPKIRPAVTLPCKDALLVRAASPQHGHEVSLRDGIDVPLRTAPGGAIVAQITTPKPPPRATSGAIDLSSFRGRFVNELERRGGAVHIAFTAESVDVEGWVPASALEKPPGMLAMLGALGGGHSGPPSLRCGHEVPIFVRRGQTVMRVGVIKPNAPIHRADDKGGDEIALDLEGESPSAMLLGLGEPEETTPAFVRGSSVADCKREEKK